MEFNVSNSPEKGTGVADHGMPVGVEDKKKVGICSASKVCGKHFGMTLHQKKALDYRLRCSLRRKKSKWISSAVFEKPLTLHQKKAREDLARYLKENDEAAAATYLKTWKSVQEQEDLAMKLVESPLHRSQKPGLLEEFMMELEDRLIKYARTKMPGLWMLLEEKLQERFGPMFKVFVSQLVLNIMLQILIPWESNLDRLPDIVHHVPMMKCCAPTEEGIKKELVNRFALAESSLEEMVDQLVKKMQLAFAQASAAEDALTVAVHNISVAK